MARKWWTLITVSIATFMLLLDVTIVNVALPEIERDLGASLTDLQWVVDSYVLALAALTLMAGSLADRLGRKLVFTVGLAAFTAASLFAGFATDALTLNIARGLQGIGGAAMFGTVLALIAQEFAPRERKTALGIWGASVGVGVAVGPLVGGVLVEYLGWEWIFFVNVPVGLLTIALALTKLREVRDPSPGRLDWAGLITFSSALFLLIFGVLRGNGEGWSSPEIVASLAGRRRPARRLRRDRAPSSRARCSTSGSSASPPSPGPRSRPSRSPPPSSRCSSTSSSTSRTSSATPRSRRDCGCSRSRPWPSSSRRLRPGSRSGFRCGR